MTDGLILMRRSALDAEDRFVPLILGGLQGPRANIASNQNSTRLAKRPPIIDFLIGEP